MPPGSRLQSYAPDVVNGKAIFFTFFTSFLAVYKGQIASASTPSLASSVNLQTYSTVSPSDGVSATQTSVRPSSTASPSLPRTFQISIYLSQTPWHEDLYNKQSPTFVALATNLTTAVSDALKTVGDAIVEVLEFKPGSVIAVLKVTTLSSNEKDMKSNLTEEMKDGQLGGFSVDPTVYSGTVFEVVLRVVSACNDSFADKGFDQKDEFEKTIGKEMSANPEFLGANIHRIDCSAAGNITILTARVQIGGPSASSPYKELSRLRSQVDAGRVGNFTVVSDWNSYTPGEKVFYVYVTLQTETSDTALTRKQLEQFVESEFKSEDNFRYVHATTPDSKTAIIEIGMASSTPELLSLALNPLASDLNRAKLGNVTVVRKENRVTVHTRSLTRKIFEVTFVQYVSSCEIDSHHKNLSQGFWQYIDDTLKGNSINEVYLETKVITIKCQNATTLRGFAYIYLKPTATDDIKQFVRPFYKCKTLINIYNAGIRITLRTPTQPVTEGKWSPVLGGVSVTYVCPKPKPPTIPPTISTATTPTPKPTSSPPTTGSPTSEASLSSTGKTTDEPSNATEPTHPPSTTGSPTTEASVSSTGKTTAEPSNATEPTHPLSTTGSPTTEASLSSTGKTTDEPSNATEPTHPPETTTPTSQPTTREIPPTLDIEPELYVKLKLGLTWGEFCAKRDALKETIAWNVRDSNDTRVSPDRIVYINVERNCADPGKKDELAVVWFYVSKSGSKGIHKDLTLQVYELFKMFFENGNTKQLGPDFQEKVVQVELAGNAASNYEKQTDCKMPSWMIILLAIAGAVGLFLMLIACCCLFCCGVRRRRRRRKYGTEHPQALHVVHVDSNGQASGATKEKEQKNGIGNEIKRPEEDDGKNVKEHGEKDGFKNGGYESDGKDKSETRQNTTDGKGNCLDQGDKSPTRKPKTVNDESDNTYGSLDNTDGLEEHTYASLNKAGSGENSSGTSDNNNSAGYITMTVPVSNGVIDRSGNRSAGEDSKSKYSGSSDVNSARASKGGESPNSGSKPRGASLIKADAGPKGGERRGSYVYYASIDDDVPLTHKTGTVGIVALAIRNKNETKKEREFKNLDKDVLNEAVKYPPGTASKNRFPDVLPAPRTRVKLSTSPDYINANWIRDHKGQISYIATQHPLHETTEDFWRMVWDQKAHTVVMVNDEEKEKPAEFVDYLPKGQGNSKQFGGISVTVKQITEKADYVLTILSIVDGKNAASPREVSHMRFTSWKERAMPNVALFVAFVTATREARKKHGGTKAPTIVHCSDGLGFSGVYIAVDIGIKSNEESKTSVVDVFELSKNLRRDRHGIVCTLEQYNFIYQALYEYTVNYNESIE